ncbi:MAG TPA: sugar phosphate isomerase/epimerase [Candidatus Binatus sp.]|nr:sugar phosphate isomerase/epimerase [Candidatus Binatus sp.]
MSSTTLSRRSFLAMSAMLPWALRGAALAAASGSIPVGLELYSVRDALKADPEGTVRAVAQMGYQAVEFYAPYFEWTETQAKQMRKLLDDLGIRCYSTHNDADYLDPKNLTRVRDLNLILGCRYVVLAWIDPKTGLDAWKAVADKLNSAAETLEPAGLKAGYHNHQAEWAPLGGQRPMDILAKNTRPSIMLQLDVGTCLEGGADPVAWIRANPGRIRSIHCKDWSRDPAKAYKVLFGEGVADWKGIFQAAESVGGVEYYLVEQEGSRFSEFETARKCLAAFRATHA